MDPLKGIGLKLVSALLFALMSALVRQLGDVAPIGQMVFFRSAFAIPPVLAIYAFRGELMSAVRTSRPFGQLGRGTMSVCGMFSNFAALTRLPLADVTAITFASPLITVVLAAVILKEHVRIYRWTAVAVGFVGVIVMLVPHFDVRLLRRRRRRDRGARLAVRDCLRRVQRRHGHPDPAADAERDDIGDRVLFLAHLRARRRG